MLQLLVDYPSFPVACPVKLSDNIAEYIGAHASPL